MTETPSSADLFHQMMTAHIELANTQKNQSSIETAGGALIHATARFSAYAAASASHDQTQFLAARLVNIDHITQMFRDALEQNYAEYGDHFYEYLGRK